MQKFAETIPKTNKSELARSMGISRAMLYYKHKRPAIDDEVRKQIDVVLTDHPAYGHKRIALELKLNKKRILRVMKKFKIKPYRRRPGKPRKKQDENKPASKYINEIEGFCPIQPNVVWVSDFTFIKFQNRFIYLATIMDLYTREIIGWNISRYHTKELVLGAFLDGVRRTKAVPVYIHSDQGSEYESSDYTALAKRYGIIVSMSRKSHPWENGFQESFYSQYKVDLGDVNRFEELGELIEAIHNTVYYYNNRRIHSTLKMSPVKFRIKNQRTGRESLSSKLGT
jgi:putative transposase